MNKKVSFISVKWCFIASFVIYTQVVSGAIPVAPSNLTATAVSLEQINLVWHDNSIDETSFEIQFYSGNTWVNLGTVAANVNTYYHKGLTSGTYNLYRVYAKNSTGNSGFSNEVQGKTPASLGTRYETKCFNSTLTSNISYGPAATSIFDLYEPSGDILNERPLVIFIHGGGFSGGDKVGNWNTLLCTNLAQRGFVVASINYRLTSTQNTLAQRYQAMVKAVQDAKAAVRFFRKNAGTYKIDTSQIFATGSSAGSITAVHLAYLQQSEVPPAYISDWSLFDGSLEGNSGNPGFSSKIHGVVNNWGAIGDLEYIKPGDVPVFCVHGTADATISYENSPAYHAMNYGSKPIVENALNKGIHAGLLPFVGVGHTLDNNTSYQNQAADAIGAWLCTVLKIYQETTPTTGMNDLKPISSGNKVSIYPNPVKCGNLTIKLDAMVDISNIEIAIINIQGQVVYKTRHQKKNVIEINTMDWVKNSIYLVTVRAGESITNSKIVVQ